MSRKNLKVEVFPEIDIEIDINRKKDSALITIHNKRKGTKRQLAPYTVAQAYTVFHKLHGIRKKMAEQRHNERNY